MNKLRRSTLGNRSVTCVANMRFCLWDPSCWIKVLTGLFFLSGYSFGVDGTTHTDLIGTEGTFTSPNYPLDYYSGSSYTWSITVAEGYNVQLVFTDFKVDNSTHCSSDRVIIRNGPDCASPRLATLCGFSIPPEIISNGNTMFVSFQSDTFVEQQGFRAQFKQTALFNTSNVVNYNCGGTINADSGTIRSPNYPNTSPPNLECIWRITTKTGDVVVLSVSDFTLDFDCDLNSLDLYEGEGCSKRAFSQCGFLVPNPVRSTDKTLVLIYKTGPSPTFSKFQLSFKADNFLTTNPKYVPNHQEKSHMIPGYVVPSRHSPSTHYYRHSHPEY